MHQIFSASRIPALLPNKLYVHHICPE